MGNICNNRQVYCEYCFNVPNDDIYVAKIYHEGKYNGKHMCKLCLLDKNRRLKEYDKYSNKVHYKKSSEN